jgi:hypothetical protein
MTRYFYTDPLAAAWMSRHFGMNIEDWPTSELCWFAHALYDEPQSPSDPVQAQRFYINPDSLYLLEPIINDVIWTVRDGFYEVRRICDVYDKPQAQSWRLHKIIERNGVGFHWPESEEA